MSADEDGNIIPLKGGKCTICGRPIMSKFRPFCSSRCADIDLGRWLKGNYRIPGSALYEGDKENEDEAPDEGTSDEPGKKA